MVVEECAENVGVEHTLYSTKSVRQLWRVMHLQATL